MVFDVSPPAASLLLTSATKLSQILVAVVSQRSKRFEYSSHIQIRANNTECTYIMCVYMYWYLVLVLAQLLLITRVEGTRRLGSMGLHMKCGTDVLGESIWRLSYNGTAAQSRMHERGRG